MLTNMTSQRSEKLSAHGREYELQLFRVDETGDYRLFVSTGGKSKGPSFNASADVIADMKSENGIDAAEVLMKQAASDILRNESGWY